uniref:Acetylcholine receptor subunit alpha n=1 Tax=Romanomermis culicivorax TaxID=13658 RepID=A0A915I693_ROMCU
MPLWYVERDPEDCVKDNWVNDNWVNENWVNDNWPKIVWSHCGIMTYMRSKSTYFFIPMIEQDLEL